MYRPDSRGGRLCEHFGGYKTINRIPLPLWFSLPPHALDESSEGFLRATISFSCIIKVSKLYKTSSGQKFLKGFPFFFFLS